MQTNGAVAPEKAGALVKQGFGSQEMALQTETSAVAVAAQAKAAVEARYTMALHRPRDFDEVRVKVLADCKRPSFAEVATYSKPIGGSSVEGPSIRFVEAVLRHMGNVLCEVATVYDDAHKRIVRVSVTDLETNTTYPKDIVIVKTVERSRVRDGQTVIGQRTNSSGKVTYIVEASEDELLNKEAALVSKAMRQLGLRIIPGDLVDEAEQQIARTQNDKAAKDPDAERKKLADAFATIGVAPSDLKTYLGHDLSQVSPAQIVELRKVFNAIKSGEATWRDTLEAKVGAAKPSGEDEANAKGSGVDALKARVTKAQQAQPEARTVETTASPADEARAAQGSLAEKRAAAPKVSDKNARQMLNMLAQAESADDVAKVERLFSTYGGAMPKPDADAVSAAVESVRKRLAA